jgi:isoamylase
VGSSRESLTFDLPMPSASRHWRRCIDTNLPSPNDIDTWDQAPIVKTPTYLVQPRSVVVLALPLAADLRP